MSGGEFWLWFVVTLLTAVAGARVFIAAWRDHDDDLTAIGSHRWPLKDDD